MKDFLKLIIENGPTWQQVFDLITALFWPLTIIICLAMFRKNLAQKISSLDSLKATTSGLEASFSAKLDKLQSLPALEAPKGLAKSGGQIFVEGSGGGTPYEQLQELRDILNGKIISKAKDLNLKTENSTATAIASELKKVGGITIQKEQAFRELIELINLAPREIGQGQVNSIRSLISNLNL